LNREQRYHIAFTVNDTDIHDAMDEYNQAHAREMDVAKFKFPKHGRYQGRQLHREEDNTGHFTYDETSGPTFGPGDYISVEIARVSQESLGDSSSVQSLMTSDGRFACKCSRPRNETGDGFEREGTETLPFEEAGPKLPIIRTIKKQQFEGIYGKVDKTMEQLREEHRDANRGDPHPSQELQDAMVAAAQPGKEKYTLGRSFWYRTGGRYCLDENKASVEGTFGTVWFGVDTQTEPETKVFIKLFRANPSKENKENYYKEMAAVTRMRDLKLNVPGNKHHVVGLFAAEQGPVFQGPRHCGDLYFQVYERCDRDLWEAIFECGSKKAQKAFTEDLARYIFKQVVHGVNHLSEHKIYNRDLKPENILLKDYVSVKITDFGLGTDESRASTIDVGTKLYNPPWELKKTGGYDTSKLEVFQCGVVLLQMLCADTLTELRLNRQDARLWTTKLFREKSFGEVCEDEHDPGNSAFWEVVDPQCKLSDQAKDLVNRMLHVDPEKRIAIQKIQDQSWMTCDSVDNSSSGHTFKRTVSNSFDDAVGWMREREFRPA